MKCSKCVGITKDENNTIIFRDVQAWKQKNRQGLVTLLVFAVKDEYYVSDSGRAEALANALNILLG